MPMMACLARPSGDARALHRTDQQAHQRRSLGRPSQHGAYLVRDTSQPLRTRRGRGSATCQSLARPRCLPNAGVAAALRTSWHTPSVPPASHIFRGRACFLPLRAMGHERVPLCVAQPQVTRAGTAVVARDVQVGRRARQRDTHRAIAVHCFLFCWCYCCCCVCLSGAGVQRGEAGRRRPRRFVVVVVVFTSVATRMRCPSNTFHRSRPSDGHPKTTHMRDSMPLK